jgi:hypothetical protein
MMVHAAVAHDEPSAARDFDRAHRHEVDAGAAGQKSARLENDTRAAKERLGVHGGAKRGHAACHRVEIEGLVSA